MTILGRPVELQFKSIVFATDFSTCSEKAWIYLLTIATRHRAKVRLIHVIDLSVAFNSTEATVNFGVFRKFAEERLARLSDELITKKIDVEISLIEGIDPAQELLKLADKTVDLLIIGTRAHKGLARMVLGSTAEMLIHRAECPIFVIGPQVPKSESIPAYRNIVYATDFSPEAARAGVFALSLAQDTNSHLFLCHVLPPNDINKKVDRTAGSDELEEKFRKALQRLVPDVSKEWCEPECVVEHGYATDGILLLARRVHADLIVMGTHHSSHWFHDFDTGVAFHVVRRAECPVLTIRG